MPGLQLAVRKEQLRLELVARLKRLQGPEELIVLSMVSFHYFPSSTVIVPLMGRRTSVGFGS